MAEGGTTDEALDSGSLLEISGSNDEEVEHDYENLRKMCRPCEKRTKKTIAVKFCKECCQFQCKDCSLVHLYYDSMKGHCLVDAIKARKDGVLDLKGYDSCKDHQKSMEFHCQDCNTIACSTCIVVNHRQCKHVNEIRTAADKDDTSTSTLRAEVTRLKEKGQLATNHWENADQTFHDSIHQLSQKVNATRKAVDSAFDQLLKSVKTGSCTLMKSTNACTKENIDRCNKIVNTLEDYIETIDNVSQFGTPEQIFIVNNQIQAEMHTTLASVVKDLDRLKTTQMEFVIKKKATLGGLIDGYDRPGFVQVSSKRLYVKPFEDELPMNLKYIAAMDITQERNETKEPLFSGIAFLTDGRLVAVDNKNDKLKVFDRDLKKLSSFKLPAHPTGVTVIREEIAIFYASSSCLEMHFFFVDTNNVIVFLRKFSLPEQFSSICVKDDNNFVMTTMNGNKPARFVSVGGEMLDISLPFSDKTCNVDESSCAYIKDGFSEKLVLVHAEESVVVIYDMKTCEEIKVKADIIVQPRSVAVCPLNTILVATMDRIVQISTSGRVLGSFATDMPNCRCICVSKERKRLAVSNAVKLSKIIKLYDIEDPVIEGV